MKKSFYLRFLVFAACLAAMLSCEKGMEIKDNAPEEFYAVMHGSESDDEPATKTVTVDGKKVLWSEGDKVSIFRGQNVYDVYVVKEGFSGKTTTTLVPVDDESFNAGNETTFDANIAWYPYANVAYSHFERENISSEPVHVLEVPIPDVQKYTANSFAPGAFPMVAVSSNKADNKLPFKNLFGVINIKLKSPKWYYVVKDITIKGNNNERLSGEALVKCSYSGEPNVEFVEGSSKDYIKLDCGDGVELIPGEDEIEFWIALPYRKYENGLTVTMNFTSGKSLEKKTPAIEIKRSVMTPMTVLDVDTDDGELYIPDTNFKNALLSLENAEGGKLVDMDGDGILTAKDAKAWNEYYKGKDVEFNVGIKFIKSLKGIEYFTSLTSLNCWGDEITSLDLSHNTALKKLNISANYNLVLDLSKVSTTLTWLDCSATATKELDLSKQTALEYLNCESNKMERLDVSNNTALKTLICCDNELTELDVSRNVALDYLNCATNKLTSLDISKNLALTYLNCNYNTISSINFGDNPALEELRCQYNQLTELDLSRFALLNLLDCGYNQMTTLDVSKTAIGSGKNEMPLACRMESLKTLYLKAGWEIKYITVDRFKSFIHENTVIEYKD